MFARAYLRKMKAELLAILEFFRWHFVLLVYAVWKICAVNSEEKMMKVVIEFDLPEGQAIPDTADIVRLTDPDWLASWWHISDVMDSFNSEEDHEGLNLTEEEGREVLRRLDKYHDCEIGINWEVIQNYSEDIINEREEK
jgi:hypothetical protein